MNPDVNKNDLLIQLLSHLDKHEMNAFPISSIDLSNEFSVEHEKLVGLLKSLSSRGKVTLQGPQEYTFWQVTEEGLQYANCGSPEAQLFNLVQSSSVPITLLSMKDIKDCTPLMADVGLKNALKLKWLTLDKSTKALCSNVESVEDHCSVTLKKIVSTSNERDLINHFGESEAFKLLSVRHCSSFCIADLLGFEKTQISGDEEVLSQLATDITQEMIISGDWIDLEFKPYNWFAAGIKPQRGSIHPLMKVLNKFKKVLLSMQFEEMATQDWVETSFWNFDACFQPQQHPARDAQDTFFLTDPVACSGDQLPRSYVDRVKSTHESGIAGSIGWRYDWSYEESEKNILRTHSTACSARLLHKLAECYKETGVFVAKKAFAIDRVFRNETLDATHLAEFHQVEGMVAAKGMSLGDLMGVLKTFYRKIGIVDLKFKPTFNPYTEPSMEIYGFHSLLNKWIEVGNSGIFRPEMLLPMGIPEDVSVLGWGLSLERPTMIQYGVRNIRELFGHKAILGTA